MTMHAAQLYDLGLACGVEANAAKLLAAEAAVEATQTAQMTFGGFGYAKEYHVERLVREALLFHIAPVTPQLLMSYIAEKALGLPKSY
jgi:acyl-CoA dehydrogenase